MRLENNEYTVGEIGTPYQNITIFKSALEKWRDHYQKVASEIPDEHPSAQFMVGLYTGKADVFTELLKHFEDLDV